MRQIENLAETADDRLCAYQRLNDSYDRRLLYYFGRGSGFGAEFVGLIKAMMLSLSRGCRLQLTRPRPPRGFAVSKGWPDYFLPVFTYVDLGALSVLNRASFPFDQRLPLLRFVAPLVLKAATGAEFFMFSMPFPLPARLQVKELGLDLDYHQACQALVSLVWRPLPDVATRIQEQRVDLGMPERYLAIHVRRGDKITEMPLVPLDRYVSHVVNHAGSIRDVYVASDDPSVPASIAALLPNDWRVWSRRNRDRNAYDQTAFNKRCIQARMDATITFMNELEVLRDASTFFGSETSNVAILVRMMRGDANFVQVDQ